MASDAGIYNLANRPTVELLDPFEIQRRRLSIQNALAAQQIQAQQIAGGALDFQERQRAIVSADQTRNALRAWATGGGAVPGGVPAPPPADPTAQALPAGPGPGSSAWDPAAASVLPGAPPPAAPAIAAPPPPAPGGTPPATAPSRISTDVPSVADLIGAGVDPIAAPGVQESFQKAAKGAAEIQESRDKSNLALQNYGSHMAAGLLKSGVNPQLLGVALDHFATLGAPYAQQAQQIRDTFAKDPEAGKRLLTQIAGSTNEGRASLAREDEVASTVGRNDRENLDAGVKRLGSMLGTTKNQQQWNTVLNGETDPKVRAAYESIPWSANAPALAQQRSMSGAEQVTTAETAKRDKSESDWHAGELDARRAELALNRKKTEFDQGAIQRAGEALGHGELTRIKDIASLRGDQRLQIYDIAKRVNPNFNISEVDRMIKNEDYYANGKGADSLRSFNTFLEHGGAASEAVNGIRLSSSPYINRPLNWWREHMSGAPEFTQLVGSLEPVRKEFEGFLLGGHALSVDDRKAANVILDDNSSPAQIQAALKTMGHTAAARANEENFRYKKVSKHDLENAFSPEAIEGAKKIGTSLNFGGSSASAPGGSPAPPAAPAPPPAPLKLPAGSVSVMDPAGGVHYFPNEAAAANFRKLANIR